MSREGKHRGGVLAEGGRVAWGVRFGQSRSRWGGGGGYGRRAGRRRPREGGKDRECQRTSLLARSLPRLSRLPAQPVPAPPNTTLCLQRQQHPKAASLSLALCLPLSQSPRPITSPAPGRTGGHFSPVQSWTPSPEPAGSSPGSQVSEGSHLHSALRLPTSDSSSVPASCRGLRGYPRPSRLSPRSVQSLFGPLPS